MPLHPYPRFLPGIWGGKGPSNGKVVRPRKSRSEEKSAGTACGQLTRWGRIEPFGGCPLRIDAWP